MERRLLLALIAVVLLVPGLSGCHSGSAVRSRRTDHQKHPASDRPVRVIYCSVAYQTGYSILEIDATKRVFDSYQENRLSRKWSRGSARVTGSTLSRLFEQINKEEMVTFRPRAEWFVGGSVPDIGTRTISVIWSDGRATFAIPPKHVRTALSSRASAVYTSIDVLEQVMVSLDRELITQRREGLSESDPSVAAALRMCNVLGADRLPAKVDW